MFHLWFWANVEIFFSFCKVRPTCFFRKGVVTPVSIRVTGPRGLDCALHLGLERQIEKPHQVRHYRINVATVRKTCRHEGAVGRQGVGDQGICVRVLRIRSFKQPRDIDLSYRIKLICHWSSLFPKRVCIWRARRDSNSRPPGSKPGTLSS